MKKNNDDRLHWIYWVLPGSVLVVTVLWLGFFFASLFRGDQPAKPEPPVAQATPPRADAPLPVRPPNPADDESWDAGLPTSDGAALDDMTDEEFDQIEVAPEEPWETAINDVLDLDLPVEQVATRLANLIPGLPEIGQLEAAQHLLNLTPDEEYATVRPFYVLPGYPASLKELIFEDLLTRDNGTALPLMVDTLEQRGHPMTDLALEHLQLFTGEDVGNEPSRWRVIVEETLQRERMEEEEAAREFEE